MGYKIPGWKNLKLGSVGIYSKKSSDLIDPEGLLIESICHHYKLTFSFVVLPLRIPVPIQMPC